MACLPGVACGLGFQVADLGAGSECPEVCNQAWCQAAPEPEQPPGLTRAESQVSSSHQASGRLSVLRQVQAVAHALQH